MSNQTSISKKSGVQKCNTGKRYSPEKVREILAFVKNHGRGGLKAAVQRYGFRRCTYYYWVKHYNGSSVGYKRGSGDEQDTLNRIMVIRNILKQVPELQEELKRQTNKLLTQF